MTPGLGTEQHEAETQPTPLSDANATRGTHFRDLLGEPRTLAWSGGFVVVIGVVVGILAGLAWGAGAAGVVLLLALLFVYAMADSRAAADFYRRYAASRSFQLREDRGYLPPATGLLRKGVRRYANTTFAGKLGGRVDGVLALYTYETETTDSKGNRQVQYHPFTVTMTEPPGAVTQFTEVACQRRAGFRFFDKAEDAFRKRQRVELESEELDRRYEIFIGQNDDMNRAKQLFSPTFIDWLNAGDEGMGFEFEGGLLVVNVPKHKENASELDALSAAGSEIHDRFATEAHESAEPGARLTSRFDPYSFAKPETAAEKEARKKAGKKGLIWIGVGLVVGLIIGIASYQSNDDDSSSSSPLDRSEYDIGDPYLATLDGELLPLIAKLDKGRGVHTDELYGHGVSKVVVGDWITDAFVRGVIEFDGGNRSFRLTPEGERAAKRE